MSEHKPEIPGDEQLPDEFVEKVILKAGEVVSRAKERVKASFKNASLAATAGLLFLNTACGLGQPPEVTPVPPTPTSPSGQVDSNSQNEQGSALAPLTERQPKSIQVTSWEVINPNSPLETIRFRLPPGTVDGNSPLVPSGDILSVSFHLKSAGIPIRYLEVSDLLGVNNLSSFRYTLSTQSEHGSMNALDYLNGVEMATSHNSNKQTFIMDEPSKNIVRKIKIQYSRSSDGTLSINISLPNEQFRFTDNNGTHEVNPAARFASGTSGLVVDRQGQGKVAVANFPLSAEQLQLFDNSNLVATAGDIKIVSPQVVEVDSNGGGSAIAVSSTEQPVKNTGKGTPQSLPQARVVSEPTPTQTQSKETSKWTSQQWAPDQTISVRDWWDDMVDKGYIRVDAVAQQYGGKTIDAVLNANLVPHPRKYIESGHPFIGNCKKQLDDLVGKGQGHVYVSPEAYSQIPGGDDCDIYAKGQ